jgi:hypothetical protein
LITVEQNEISEGAPQRLMRILRRFAAERGCDGVMVNPPSWKNGAERGEMQRLVYSGTCIVFVSPTAENDVAANPAATASAPAAPTEPPAPPGVVPPRFGLVVASEGDVRTAPFIVAPLLMQLATGQRLALSGEATNGWFVVKLPDGRVGYVQDTQIRLE